MKKKMLENPRNLKNFTLWWGAIAPFAPVKSAPLQMIRRSLVV